MREIKRRGTLSSGQRVELTGWRDTAAELAIEVAFWIGLGIAILILALVTGCGNPHWPQIYVGPQLIKESPESYYKQETLQALNYFCAQRDLDCDLFTHELHIELYAEAIDSPYFDSPVYGLYFFQEQLLILQWRGGPSTNSLFHELLHRECYRANGWRDFIPVPHKHHTKEFLGVVDRIKIGYEIQQGGK